ncbi:Na+/H+ antiporter subunit G [Peribacillus cavernae]|uniref:Na+/H+ antiporter subunit G n=1 Tax=Peribacillus cavernae TaxID=1674310 RepID=A0A433HBY4_9BACI|nr:monovalent cation/H(+) antiporter subunit G [Peribacillus cavernae]MDQ0219634.1 multicomponent Na+:H+ antiporter subunit G [Peribacillus cavernae]RUQ25920.1 Na+/H+ antiporter subunit G [Peribacillus cavernae]
MTEIFKFTSGALILLGAFLSLVSALGIIRLPDVYTRNHAASKSLTLGIMSLLLGTFIYVYIEHGYFNSRILLGIVFIFMTAPVAGHLISRAAYNTGVKVWGKNGEDDLEESRNREASHSSDEK